ncbi:hypothetical protein [Novosphingobium lentum]|uniref:hypothetical protein n=1 Tax=Novosphingobium lentum TaxID=145287 RepID=UPI000831F5AD|nr:hypothetical protein [Novosphingobium lentum]
MRLILTALIFLAGLFDLFLAFSFLFDPTNSGGSFGLTPQGLAGLAVLRADFTAFFGVAAVCMMWGAWRRNADLLLVPALLFGTALTVRCFSLAKDGAAPGFLVPMAVEAFHVVLLLAAWRLLPHHTIEQITE